MTNPIALVLAVVIVLALAADLLFLGGMVTLAVGRRGAQFVEYLAFWR